MRMRSRRPKFVSIICPNIKILNLVPQDRDALNTAVHDIELAVELGRNLQATGGDELIGTELLLKRVASQVSSSGSSGGLLKQIKEFNAFLQRAAVALETRKI